jgi:2C-methyl-D-erythritol 2,4-cyclodiphosphate synthase
MVIVKQGRIAKRTFNAANGTIDNITTTIVFSYYKLNPYREIAKEQ